MRNEINVIHKLFFASEWNDQLTWKRNRVLFACESGSRAWGFHSEDSDFDIRFVYVKPIESYLSLNPGSDTVTIRIPEYNIDAHGWDISKFLKLARGGNISPFEWLYCPVYFYKRAWYDRTQKFLDEIFDPWVAVRHHIGLAQKHFDRFIMNEEFVSAKKYLYIYRSLLAAEFIVEYGERPPIEFMDLMDQLVKDFDVLYQRLYKIVAVKMTGGEDVVIESSPLLKLDARSRAEKILDKLDSDFPGPKQKVSWERLDEEFRYATKICDSS